MQPRSKEQHDALMAEIEAKKKVRKAAEQAAKASAEAKVKSLTEELRKAKEEVKQTKRRKADGGEHSDAQSPKRSKTEPVVKPEGKDVNVDMRQALVRSKYISLDVLSVRYFFDVLCHRR